MPNWNDLDLWPPTAPLLLQPDIRPASWVERGWGLPSDAAGSSPPLPARPPAGEHWTMAYGLPTDAA